MIDKQRQTLNPADFKIEKITDLDTRGYCPVYKVDKATNVSWPKDIDLVKMCVGDCWFGPGYSVYTWFNAAIVIVPID